LVKKGEAMDAEQFFAGTRVYVKEGEGNEFYLYGDKDVQVVPAHKEGFKDQVLFRCICQCEDSVGKPVLKARELVVGMHMGRTIVNAFRRTDWTGWIRGVKKKNDKGRVAWHAERYDAEAIDPGKVKALVVDLDAMIYARGGAENVTDDGEQVPF
jgi:hypothetical protein